MSLRTSGKRKRSGAPRAFRKITRSSGKIEMIDGMHEVPGGSRFSDWLKRKKWGLAVRRNDVWKRLDDALDEFEKLDTLVAKGDKEAIRGLALEFRLMGTRYNFGVRKKIDMLYDAEMFLGGCKDELVGLVDGPFNSTENLPNELTLDFELMDRVLKGKKPGATVSADLEKRAKEGGLLVIRNKSEVHVSLMTPVGEIYSAEFVLQNFSGLHPLVTDSLERTFETIKKYTVARLLKNHKVFDRSGKAAHVVIHILNGLFYGYPLRNIYEYVHRRIFYPKTLPNLEPIPIYKGKREEYRCLNFKRFLGPKITG